VGSGHPRVSCAVAGCHRSTTTIENRPEWRWLNTGTNDPGWLCGTHWPRVPRALKTRRSAVTRLWKRRLRKARVQSFWELPPGSPQRIAIVRTERLLQLIWVRCVRIAAGDRIGDSPGLPPGLEEELRRAGL
jgi:hypothetical protein